MTIRFIWILLILGFLSETVYSQSPVQIENYDPETYNDFRQNWAVIQDSTGILFFGNSNALLNFDGERWSSRFVPKGNAVISFAEFKKRIYWGGIGDFGEIKADSLNSVTPYSLRSRIDSSYHDFSAVWQILNQGEKLYHRISNKLYVWDSDTVTVIPTDLTIRYITFFQDQIIVNTEEQGLSILQGEQFVTIPFSESYKEDSIFESIQFDDRLLLVSREQGFVWFDGEEFEIIDAPASEYLKQNNVYRGVKINDTEAAFATLSGGILIVDKSGKIINTITEEDGLLTNTIYNLYLDHEGILWAATEFGIAKLLLNESLQKWSDTNGFDGNTLFIERNGNNIFAGTTEGLFSINRDGNMRRHEEFQWRVYDGFNHESGFLVSTHEGTFQMQDGIFQKQFDNRYLFFIDDLDQPNSFYGVNSKGIEHLIYQNGVFAIQPLIELDTEIRYAILDEEIFWIIGLNNQVYQFTKEGELKAQYNAPILDEERVNFIGKFKDKIRLATNAGLFWFDESLEKFIPDSTFNDPEIVDEEVFRFQQCGENEIWFRNNGFIKRTIKVNDEWTTNTDPYRTIARNEGLETIYCDEDGSVWFGGSQNLYHLSDPDWTYEHNFNTNITGVLIHNDSLIYGGYGEPPEIKELKFEENELRFTYAAASYIEPEANEYRTRLRGYEEEWSNWSGEPQKDYTFIPEGTYTFEVQGRNVYHKTGSIDSYTFTVLPPWYRTIWAYLGYLLLAAGMVYAGHRIRINSILKEQRIRDGIARDLHDELSSTLSSISFFANAMDSPKQEAEKENRYLSLIKKSSLEAKEKISDIVWVIHTENDDWENLLMRCKRFASDILDARDIQHSFEIKGSFTGKPSITQKKNIWLIFREIITNIARHAEANQVDIRFSRDAKNLHIHIEDEGKGFDPENTREGGYGVQNIKERANQMKGKCTLESMPGEGTRWVIDIPVG